MSTSTDTQLTSDVLVTGEAVALHVQPASLPLRIISGLIDVAASLLGIFLTFALLALVAHTQNEAQMATEIASVLALWIFIVPFAVETVTQGYSLGKWAVGNRAIRDDGGPIRARHALIRVLLSIAEIWLSTGFIAILTAMINRRGKRMGDYLAGTYVVAHPAYSKRLPLLMPPDLAQWAAHAQVRALPGPLGIQARRFLEDGARMTPGTRVAQGQNLASELLAYVSPPPPPGTHPERFIAAVLVLRRDIDYDLLRARQKREVTAN
ncbi:MAG: RDD family protein [Actinomycetaceae bacterium]|nr:RDD family protein [Actinomycetaceae bacterium]